MDEMIVDHEQRRRIARELAEAINSLVREHYKGLHEEPDITSRIGQRLEDRFDGQQLAGYQIRVIAQTIPSHGPKSLERPLGTDLYVALSVKPEEGAPTTKGLLIQAKRQDRLSASWRDLQDQCRRMNLVTKKGSVVWLYGPEGVAVMRSPDVTEDRTSAVPLERMIYDVLRCWIGDKRKFPKSLTRPALRDMLRNLGAKNGVLLELRQLSSRT